MKVCNGHIFLKKITSSNFRFRKIRTNFEEQELLTPIGCTRIIYVIDLLENTIIHCNHHNSWYPK